MADARPPDADLPRALVQLGAGLAYPPTPDLGAAVRARLAEGARRRPRPGWAGPGRRLALALGLLLLALGLGALALPAARAAVAEWLGLSGVVIRSTPRDPTPPAPPLAGDLSLGEPRSLAEARASVPFAVATPAALGPPDAAYIRSSPPGGLVTLLYRPRTGLPEAAETGVGLLLMQFQATVQPGLIQKGVGPGATVTPVEVGGVRGWWISGAPHSVIFQDANGRTGDDPARLAANTLLWARDGITYRLEAAVPLVEALRIAASLR